MHCVSMDLSYCVIPCCGMMHRVEHSSFSPMQSLKALCTWTWGWAEENPNGTGVWKWFSCYCWSSDRHWFKPVQSTVSEGEFKLILKWKWGTRGNFFKLKSALQSHLNCCHIYSWMWWFTETKVQKMWCTNTSEANCVTTRTGRSTVLYQSE